MRFKILLMPVLFLSLFFARAGSAEDCDLSDGNYSAVLDRWVPETTCPVYESIPLVETEYRPCLEGLGMLDEIYFASGSALLDWRSIRVLRYWASYFQSEARVRRSVAPGRVYCAVFSIQTNSAWTETSDRDDAFRLGEKRGAAIAAALRFLGLPKAEIDVFSYGRERPWCLDETSDAAAAVNRSAFLIVYSGDYCSELNPSTSP